MKNDLTPFLEICNKHINKFIEFKPVWRKFVTNAPYEMAAITVKHEFWQDYLKKAISIAEKCTEVPELLEKISKLNEEIPDEWYDDNVIL